MTPWTLQRLERAVETFSAQLQCAICLCAYDNPVSLPCNHCFCEECIHRALELKPLCPICKTPAKKRRLRYDTTVQELLRAMNMLCAAPTAATEATAKAAAAEEEDQTPIVKKEKKVVEKTVENEPNKAVKAAASPAKVAAAVTPERRRKRSSQKSSQTPTLMDKWVSGSQQLKNGMKMKQEKVATPVAVATVVRRSSPRRALTQELNSQAMSPALFEISGPVVAKEKSCGNVETNGKVMTPRRRRSGTDAVDGDVVAETQLDIDQQRTPTRRRRGGTNADTIQDETQLEPEVLDLRVRRRSVDGTTDETQLEAVEPKLQTPTPRKRRRSATNGLIADAGAGCVKEKSVVPMPNGKVAHTNGSAEASSLTVDSQAQVPIAVEVFQVGDLVDVVERQWVGINKRGGAGRITKVKGDGFYAVKFLIGSGSDNNVPGYFIRRPTENMFSDSTPSRAVRKRQRRQPSDIMTSPDLLARSSPHSTEKKKNKTQTKSKRKGSHSGMVFLCSGFKGDRMQQIDEWADQLGADVVQHWTNHVTHLIVKCVSDDNVGGEDPSMDDSDSASSPQGHQGKRDRFSDQKPGRWVKIRSLKYLKALVGGRWIVSDEWLQACADHGGYVIEVNYEADGHWKGKRIHDAVKRSRLTREKLLQLSSPNVDRCDVGTMLFADFCFHVIGEFLPPMPPISELNTLICMGGGKLIAFMDEIPDEMHKRDNHTRKLIIVSDKINPIALRQQTKQLQEQPQVKAVTSAIIVNYLWVINSISEAKLRELP